MEIPREFYNKHRHELAQFISAEVCDDIAYLTFVRGPKQVVVQFDLKKFLSANERKSEAQYMCAWPWVNEIAKYPNGISWEPSAGNWCYISRSQKRGHLTFTQRDKPVDRRKLKEQPWARLIPEEDIDLEEVGPMYFRYGKWRGRDVDIYRVWMDSDFPLLDRAMKAYRRLQDTTLTYDLIGHLVDSSGSLVGLVTEPMHGRAICLHDAPLVFSALRELNSVGYILETPDECSMLVTAAGELKITAVHNLFRLSDDPDKRDAEIKRREDWCQKWIFDGTADKSHKGVANVPHWRDLVSTKGKFVVPICVMVPLNEPERILSFDGTGSGKWAVEKFKDVWSAGEAEDPMEIWRLVRGGGVKRLLEAESSDEEDVGLSMSCPRPMKKLKGLKERSVTPLPRLPVALEDFPLMPPSVFDIQHEGRERSSSGTLYEGSPIPTAIGGLSPPPYTSYSPLATEKGVIASNVPSWLLEGDWLQLANTSRFEIVD